MKPCFIFVKKADTNLLLNLSKSLGVLPESEEKNTNNSELLGLEENEIGVTQIGNWGVLVSNCYLFLEREATPTLTEFSKGTEIFFVLTEDTSAGLWFEYHVDGQLLRKWVEVESEVAVNIGEPLDQEPVGFFNSEPDEDGERDEWKLFDLCEKVTGISTQKLFSDCLTVYS